MTPEPAAHDLIKPHLRREATRAVLQGSLVLARFGGAIFVAASVMWLTGRVVPWIVPAFVLTWTSYALLIHGLARRGWIDDSKVYAVFLPLLALPSVYLVLGGLVVQTEISSINILGPAPLLYFPLLVITGFMFDDRLSRWAGVVAGVGYLLSFLLVRSGLVSALVGLPGSALLVDWPIHVVKAGMMVAVGFLVGALASTSHRLIRRVLEEEHEKQGISRLFGQFVSNEVKEKILREKAGLVGERKRVVVLFSDIRSFTTYSEEADPALLVAHLNEYFDQMVGAITSNGGVIDKFIGDAVMAVFGGVLDLPNPADAALKAAHEMRSRLVTLNERWAKEGIQMLDNGIGMHFGEVLQGAIGSAERKEFTVIGDTVNIAARLEGISKDHGYPILVSAAFVSALSDGDNRPGTPLGSVNLKGRAQAIEIIGFAPDGSSGELAPRAPPS